MSRITCIHVHILSRTRTHTHTCTRTTLSVFWVCDQCFTSIISNKMPICAVHSLCKVNRSESHSDVSVHMFMTFLNTHMFLLKWRTVVENEKTCILHYCVKFQNCNVDHELVELFISCEVWSGKLLRFVTRCLGVMSVKCEWFR